MLPTDILSEEFSPDELHPADIEEVITTSFETYKDISRHLKKKFRDAYNSLVDLLAEKRGYKQFNYL